MGTEFDAYRSELALNDLHPRTLAKYRQVLTSYQNWLAGREASPATAKEFLAYLRSEKGYRRKTTDVYYVVVRAFHESRGQPFTLRLRKETVLPPYVGRPEVERLIAQAYQGLRSHTVQMRRRNGAMVQTMAYAGLRRGEILNLRVGDLDFDRRTITVRQGKGYKDGVIIMAQRLVIPLRALCEGRNSRDRVFSGLTERKIHRIVKQLGRKIGWDTVHPHLLRHYFCTQLLEVGATVKEVQELARHASLETTSLYLGLSQTHLKAAIDKLDPPVGVSETPHQYVGGM